jgi:hypothetical protein
MDASHGRYAKRFWMAGQLFETARALRRQQIRRAFPGISPEELKRHIAAWLAERPGAENGDGVGRVVPWPRR